MNKVYFPKEIETEVEALIEKCIKYYLDIFNANKNHLNDDETISKEFIKAVGGIDKYNQLIKVNYLRQYLEKRLYGDI